MALHRRPPPGAVATEESPTPLGAAAGTEAAPGDGEDFGGWALDFTEEEK